MNINYHPIIFVHGFGCDFRSWQPTVDRLVNKEYGQYHPDVYLMKSGSKISVNPNENRLGFWLIDYNPITYQKGLNQLSDGNIDDYVITLESLIDKILAETHAEKVSIVAHSMGGLVARRYIANSVENYRRVYRLLTVGTPNLGVYMACNLLESSVQMRRQGSFITRLNWDWEKVVTDPCRWGVIGGVDGNNCSYFDYSGKAHDNLQLPIISGNIFPEWDIRIDSAIPFEWKEAIGKNIGWYYLNTPKFGFRLATGCTHNELLKDEGTIRGIRWIIEDIEGKR